MWIKFKFSRVKFCLVVGYYSNEGIGEERETFWNGTDRSVDRVNGYRLCVLGDLNGLIGDRVRAGITDAFGVPEENKNGRRVVEFCATSNTRICITTQGWQGAKMEWR